MLPTPALQVGGFTLMATADMRRVAPLWLKISEDVRDDPLVRSSCFSFLCFGLPFPVCSFFPLLSCCAGAQDAGGAAAAVVGAWQQLMLVGRGGC